MNLSRSIQILLSSSIQGERGASIALYELREKANRLQLCGVVGETSLAEWAEELPVNTQNIDTGQLTLLGGEDEKLHIFPVENDGAVAGILCVRPSGTAGVSKTLLAKINTASKSLGPVLALAKKIRSYDNLVSEISALHIELADQKISDRARGLLLDEESANVIAAHVNRVSESIKFTDELRSTIDDIRSQLNARQLLHKAKEKLQKDQGITEEEAYLTLRHMSRRTRTPLGDIAQLVLAEGAKTAAVRQ